MLIKRCSILQITVTLKITRDRKPIAPSYTTKVPRGTLLVDILNKAAGAEGAFNKYESIYYGGTYKGVLLGYYIIAMDGIKQDPATKSFWMIIDEKTKDYTPCGISSYVPVDGSTTIFDFSPLKLDKPCPPYRGSGYCKKALPSGQVCYAPHPNPDPHPKLFTLSKPWESISTLETAATAKIVEKKRPNTRKDFLWPKKVVLEDTSQEEEMRRPPFPHSILDARPIRSQ